MFIYTHTAYLEQKLFDKLDLFLLLFLIWYTDHKIYPSYYNLNQLNFQEMFNYIIVHKP